MDLYKAEITSANSHILTMRLTALMLDQNILHARNL